LGGVGVPTTLEVGFFCPIPNVQFDHFLHYTPKLGIPVAMVVSFETFVATDFLLCTTISIDFSSQISFP